MLTGVPARSGLSPRDATAVMDFARSATEYVADRPGLVDDGSDHLLATMPAIAAAVINELTPLRAKPDDRVRARIVELVAIVDEHNRRLSGPDGRHEQGRLEIGRRPLAVACRSLCAWLEQGHPGRSVEVRVPPYAAVQCGIGPQGPTHTRGTPPNVVETDPLTFLRLATGRLDWSDALAGHLIAASGQRADLSSALPIQRLTW
jgi:hypothetical protein